MLLKRRDIILLDKLSLEHIQELRFFTAGEGANDGNEFGGETCFPPLACVSNRPHRRIQALRAL